MTILISIVSKQTIPNILFIKEKQAEVDKFLFVNTEYTLKGKFSERIKTVCGIAEEDCVNVKVVEDNVMDVIQQIRLKFEEHRLFDYTRFLVNVTGGTKPMALGVYTFFEKKINNAEFYYITFPKSNQYQRLYDDCPPEYYDLNYRIPLKDYLLAYGFSIDTIQTDLFKDFEYTKKLALMPVKDAIAEIKQYVQKGMEEKAQRYYQYNGYLEEYIYTVFKTQLGLADDCIGLSVKTLQPLVDDGEISDHELDVIFTYENQLYVIECKVGPPNPFENTVFKLFSIKQRIGFCHGYIAMLKPLREEGKLPIFVTKKAKPSGIIVLDGTDIKEEAGFLNAIQQIKNKHHTS